MLKTCTHINVIIKHVNSAVPQKFLREKLRFDSGQTVAAKHATLGEEPSSSEQDRACILAMESRYRQGTCRHYSAGSDMSVEDQLRMALESSDRITIVEVVQ